jgi:hypothetical protein
LQAVADFLSRVWITFSGPRVGHGEI